MLCPAASTHSESRERRHPDGRALFGGGRQGGDVLSELWPDGHADGPPAPAPEDGLGSLWQRSRAAQS